MATLNDLDLGLNTRWTNEFDGAAFDREKKYTEDGRLFVFQRKKQVFKSIVYDCTGEWLAYSTAIALAEIRDSGQVAVLTHNDGRVFNVLLESIQGLPLRELNQYKPTSQFKLVLNFMEI